MNLSEFEISIFGELEPISPTLSKARCRTFYKGLNRNGGYIDDQFADKLASSFPYTPIKGIYNKDDNDFTTHGEARDEGRIYGVVPADPHITYEAHLDEDGITREYCTADVYLYTAIYQEASEIPGKSQSMELYVPSIKGNWQYRQGKRCYVYTDACFLGLQVLGDSTEPCFEGAAFYELEKPADDELINILNKYVLLNEEYKTQREDLSDMKLSDFKLSDDQKANKLWYSLNPKFNEEDGYEVEYSLCQVYDDYAICFNYAQEKYFRAYYTKNDEDDTVTLGELVECFMVDVTASELAALKAVQAINGGSYENLDANFQKNVDDLAQANLTINSLNEQIGEKDQKIEAYENEKVELGQQISTLSTERDNIKTELKEAQNQFSALETEKNNLQAYKDNIILAQKKDLINTYSAKLDNTIIEKYTDEFISKFTLESLEKELAYDLVNSNSNSIFSNNDNSGLHFNGEGMDTDPLNSILAGYVKD